MFVTLGGKSSRTCQKAPERKVMTSSREAITRLSYGLTHRDFDLQTGLASPGSVIGLLYLGRYLAFKNEGFLDLLRLSTVGEGRLFFARGGELHISDHYYNRDLSERPMTIKTELVSFRKSSFIMDTTIAMQGTLNTVASLSSIAVLVAMDTRRSTALPDWWVETYKAVHERRAEQKFKPLIVPSKIICKAVESKPYNVYVQRRDQDQYNHLNTALFIQYCLDALEHHLHTNDVDCDINTVSLLLKTANFLHRGESKMGDMLTVAFWDDETDPETVCFDISKSGQSVYQARMQFYGKSVISQPESKL